MAADRRTQLASLLALGIAAAHFASYDVYEQAIVTDVRNYLYFSWRMTEGVPPHLSGFDPKTHLATILGAALYRLAEFLGADPLIVIRAGYLGLAALGGWAAFLVHRRLGDGAVAGMLGLAAYLSFGFIGTIASIGNSPKLILCVAAPFTALLVHRQRWLAAGAVSALAFLDWQVGALVCIAAFGSALAFAERRGSAALRVVAGGLLVAAPYALYFAANGALGIAFEQTFVSALERGSAFAQQRSFPEHVAHVLKRVRLDTGPQFALLLLGLAGVLLVAVRTWQWRGDERLRLLLPLAATHVGLLGFSLIDFQGRGDSATLLHSIAFFLALVWVGALDLVRRFTARGLRASTVGALLLTAAVLARPGPTRPEIPVATALVGAGATLSDQRNVAEQVREALGDRSLGVLQSAELLFLLRRVNAFPTVYWNVAAIQHLGRPGETEVDVFQRLLDESQAQAFLFFSPRNPGGYRRSGWREERLRSENGEYVLRLNLSDS